MSRLISSGALVLFLALALIGLYELLTGRGFSWQLRFNRGRGRGSLLNRIWGLGTMWVGAV